MTKDDNNDSNDALIKRMEDTRVLLENVATKFNSEMPYVRREIKELKDSQQSMIFSFKMDMKEQWEKIDRMNVGIRKHYEIEKKAYNDNFEKLDGKINAVEKKQNYFIAIATAVIGVVVFLKNSINIIISDIIGGIK